MLLLEVWSKFHILSAIAMQNILLNDYDLFMITFNLNLYQCFSVKSTSFTDLLCLELSIYTAPLKPVENKKSHLEFVYQNQSQENNSINNNVTVTKVTDNKIIPPLGMNAIT